MEAGVMGSRGQREDETDGGAPAPRPDRHLILVLNQ